MSTTLLSSAYLPPVSYFTLLYRSDKCTIERYCHYTKQTYRNRCHISGANGILPLSIPVVKPDTPKCHTCDIRISDHGEWRHLHWNAIVSAYGSSPFFEYYADELHPFTKRNTNFCSTTTANSPNGSAGRSDSNRKSATPTNTACSPTRTKPTSAKRYTPKRYSPNGIPKSHYRNIIRYLPNGTDSSAT